MDVGRITFGNSGALESAAYSGALNAANGVIPQPKPHQQRVIEEKAELDGRIVKLAAFIETLDKPNSLFAMLPEPERARLYAQHRVMVEYSTILGERIAAFR